MIEYIADREFESEEEIKEAIADVVDTYLREIKRREIENGV